MLNAKQTIVVVGGGAGGLELIAKLGDKYKNNDTIEIILIDKQLKHVWKPLYHEIAAGTFHQGHEEIDYISYAYQKGFRFIFGILTAIDRVNQTIVIKSGYQIENINNDIILPYDVLLLALGSHVNDFNTPGVKENCFFLDNLAEAENCNQTLIKQIILASQSSLEKINICIVGAGATGVELAAEFNHVLYKTKKYNAKDTANYHFQISIFESGKRILGMLPERVSTAVTKYLQADSINIFTDTKITSVHNNGLSTIDGRFFPADMIIWAAGVKGNADKIKHDLAVNAIDQFLVRPTLQTTQDDKIFSFGDCASCPQVDKYGQSFTVPPRAQAAHQQAEFLINAIDNLLTYKSISNFHYRDYGSLISLSRYQVIGNIMSKIAKSLYLEGIFARFAYWSLYKKHLLSVKGYKYVLLSTIANLFMKKQRPEIKLH